MSRKRLLAAVSALGLILAMSSFKSNLVFCGSAWASSGNDWSLFHHDERNTRYSTSSIPEKAKLKKLWDTSETGVLNFEEFASTLEISPPLIVEDKVIISVWGMSQEWVNKAMEELFSEYFGLKLPLPLELLQKLSVIFTPAHITKVYILNLEDGEVIAELPPFPGRVILAANDNRLFIGMKGYADPILWKGGVACVRIDSLKKDSGIVEWENFDIPLESVITVADNKVLVDSVDSEGIKLNCLNANNGQEIWHYKISGLLLSEHITGPPAVANGKVFFATDEYKLYCLDANTGKKVWQNTIDGPYVILPSEKLTPPAVANGKVYVGGEDAIYCLNENDGSEIYRYSEPGSFSFPLSWLGDIILSNGNWSPPTVTPEGRVYVHYNSASLLEPHKIYCLEPKDGKLERSWEFPVAFHDNIVAVRDKVLISNNVDDKLYCLNGINGDVIWEKEIEKDSLFSFWDCADAPRIADGKIFMSLVHSSVKHPHTHKMKLICLGEAPVSKGPSLTSYSLTPTTANPGDTLTIKYTINNPTSKDIAVGLGCSIQKSGTTIWISDPNNDKVVNVVPGAGNYSRDFVLPSTLSSGNYKVAWRLWSSDFASTYNYKESTDALTVVPKPQEIQLVRRLGIGEVHSVDWSPDRRFIATGTNSGVHILDSQTLEIYKFIMEHKYVESVAFSPDSSLLASGSRDHTIKLWKVSDGERIATLNHGDSVNSVAFSPDGKVLASGGWDRTVKLWRVSDGKRIATLEGHLYSVQSVAFSPDGSLLASGSKGNIIKLWNVSTGENIRTLEGHKDNVYSVAFSPDGSLIASGSGDKTVKLWRVSDGECTATLKGHKNRVYSVAFSSDGSLIASGDRDNTIKLWGVSDGESIATLKEHEGYVNSVAFSPDSSLLVSGSMDNTIGLWRVGTPMVRVPDLTLMGKDFEFHLKTTDVLKIQAWISNIGNTTARDVRVEFFDNDVLIGADTIMVPAEEQNVAKVKWGLSRRKTENHRISVKIVSSNPPEQNTPNNEASKTLSVYYVDSGRSDDPFRVGEDGYSFPNWGMNPEDAKESFRSWWRDQDLPDKVLRVLLFANPALITGIKGHCYGMASTSILYRDYPNRKPVDKETYKMKKEDPGVVGKIRVYHAAGGLPPTLELLWIKSFGGYDVSEEYSKAFDYIVNKNKPVLQLLAHKDQLKFGNHAIVGYMILDLGDEKRVYVYENETPGATDVYVQYNLAQKKEQVKIYDYDLVLSPYPFVDREKLKRIISDLWTEFIQSLKEKGKHLFLLGSPAYLTVTDSLGRRAGFVNGEIVNEIPEASIEEFGGAQAVYVPNDLAYHIETTGAETGSITLDIVATGIEKEAKQISYEDIPTLSDSKTWIDLDPANPDFTIAVDKDANEVADETLSPDSIVSTDEMLLKEYPSWDVNSDGEVNIFDLVLVGKQFGESGDDFTGDVNSDEEVNIFDLVLVAKHFGEEAAPPIYSADLLQQVYDLLKAETNPNLNLKLALQELERLLAPSETKLLQNYPNPGNPETWIPFELSQGTNVVIQIHDIGGKLVRRLDLGYREAGIYRSKRRAAYWDGKNDQGEKVASGVYIYQMMAGDRRFARKVIVVK